MSYKKYLNSNHWKKLRIKFINKRGKCCEICFSNNNLCVHHQGYKNLHKERYKNLRVLCSRCHQLWHKYHSQHLYFSTQSLKRAHKLIMLGYSIDETIRFFPFWRICQLMYENKKHFFNRLKKISTNKRIATVAAYGQQPTEATDRPTRMTAFF